jgi:hypothetical protein
MPSARVAFGLPNPQLIQSHSCMHDPSHADTYLDRTEDPKNEGLHDDKGCRSHTESKIDADVLAHLWVTTVPLIHL